MSVPRSLLVWPLRLTKSLASACFDRIHGGLLVCGMVGIVNGSLRALVVVAQVKRIPSSESRPNIASTSAADGGRYARHVAPVKLSPISPLYLGALNQQIEWL